MTVENKPNASNLAYLSVELSLHNELPQYDYSCGVGVQVPYVTNLLYSTIL